LTKIEILLKAGVKYETPVQGVRENITGDKGRLDNAM
jgi:hypothetical protein